MFGFDIDIELMQYHFFQLGIAFILSLPIALNREMKDNGAGLRTFPLVTIASCAFMLVGMDIYDSAGEARIMYAIITGMGFIGGGAIFKNEEGSKGTATAASLWMVAAIGLAIGGGMIKIGIASTVIMLVTLVVFHGWEKKFPGATRIERRYIHIVAHNNSDAVSEILKYLTEQKIKVRNINLKNDDMQDTISLELFLKINKDLNNNDIIAGIQAIDGVISLENVV